MRIGIMGGTFDPIHNGHLMLGEYAYQQFHLDEVWYMPNGNPPHKSNPEIRKDLQDRAEMTRLAIEEIPYFQICTYEMDRKETSYSYQTMEYHRCGFSFQSGNLEMSGKTSENSSHPGSISG